MSDRYLVKIKRKSDNKIFYMLSGHRCRKCGKKIEDKYWGCNFCGRGIDLEYVDSSMIFGYYDKNRRDLALSEEILNLKKNPRYANKLAELLEILYNESIYTVDCIVPVPPTYNRMRENGFNQSSILASELAKSVDIDYRDILYFNRETKKMTGLNREERKENIDGAISVKEEFTIPGNVVGIVDDVMTTGTTINECAKILKEKSGVKEVIGIILGRSIPDDERELLC